MRYEQNNEQQVKYKLTINTTVHPIQMFDIFLIILYCSSIQVAQTGQGITRVRKRPKPV